MRKLLILISLAVLASSFAWDDADVIATLKEKLATYNAAVKRKKIDLVFDQPEYAPGDTAYVRTLYLQAGTRQPAEEREIIYIEFFDVAGKSVLREQIAVEKGWAANRIVFPEKLAPGLYQVVAWSDWMRNLDPSLFYRREIILAGGKAIEKFIPKNDTRIEFYPAGGQLIAGVKNTLVLRRIGNRNFSSVNFFNGQSLLVSTTFDRDGLAEVSLTPETGAAYHAEITVNQETRKFDAPAVQANGFAMNVVAGSDNAWSFKLEAGEAFGKSSGHTFYFVATNAVGIAFYDRLALDEHGAGFVKLPGNLPPGIVECSVFDESMKVWSTRVVYIPGSSNIVADVKTDKKQYVTREETGINLQVSDEKGFPLSGYFTTRVISTSLFSDSLTMQDSFLDNIMLYSDVAATFKIHPAASSADIQRYLVTQTCPWLNWTKILAGKPLVPFAAKRNPTLTGVVTALETGQPVPDSTEVTFFVDQQLIGYEEQILDKGKFDFPLLFDFYGPDRIFYAATYHNRDIKNAGVSLIKTDSNRYSFPAANWTTVEREDPYAKFRMQKSVIDKSFGFFGRDSGKTDSVIDRNVYFEKAMQGADITFLTKDYVIFPNMVELIREVLKAVDYRKMKGQDVVRVYTSNRQLPTPYVTPLFVIDGIFTKDASAFMKLIPAEIISIKIIRNSNKLTKLGDLGAHGVILVRTKNPEGSEKFRPENIFPVTGVSAPVRNRDLSFLKKGKQNPDLRSSLHWGAQSSLDAQGKASVKFRTSDDVGTYAVIVEGITAEGLPFSKEEKISVKFELQP